MLGAGEVAAVGASLFASGRAKVRPASCCRSAQPWQACARKRCKAEQALVIVAACAHMFSLHLNNSVFLCFLVHVQYRVALAYMDGSF